jgi:phage I-like protein
MGTKKTAEKKLTKKEARKARREEILAEIRKGAKAAGRDLTGRIDLEERKELREHLFTLTKDAVIASFDGEISKAEAQMLLIDAKALVGSLTEALRD